MGGQKQTSRLTDSKIIVTVANFEYKFRQFDPKVHILYYVFFFLTPHTVTNLL